MIPKPTDTYCPKSPGRGKKRGRHRWGKLTHPEEQYVRCVHCGHKKGRYTS